jgi:transposase
VWSFAEGLDLSALYGAIKAVEGHPGHPPADPRILLALWLYATVEGVGSARELDRLCREHIGFEWLCGGVGMNHTTLADFRVAHGAVLECLLVDSFAAMLKTGHASLERVAQDGMRVRAAAGARRRLVPPPGFAGALSCRGDGRGRPAARRARGRPRAPEPAPSRRPAARGGGARAARRGGPGCGRATGGQAA